MLDKEHIQELLEFIRQHRSNEANFEKLHQRLEDELRNGQGDQNYIHNLQEIKNKQAEEFRQTKETGGSAWPEFEKFVSDFEKTLTETLKEHV